MSITGRPPRLRLTSDARRARRWSLGLGLASSLAIITLAALGLVLGLVAALGNGPEPVGVPDVEGKTLEEAESLLNGVGLRGQQIDQVFSDDLPAGAVISQRPYAGKWVKQGRVVDLTVSRGPKSVEVPRLVGKRFAEAEKLLREAYLQVGQVRREPSEQSAETVLEQSPAAGRTTDRDTAVDLRVSGGPDYGIWKGPGEEEWRFRKLTLVIPAGPSLQRVRVVLESGGEDEALYDEMRRPGDKVTLDLRGKRGAKVKVYLEEKRVFTQNL